MSTNESADDLERRLRETEARLREALEQHVRLEREQQRLTALNRYLQDELRAVHDYADIVGTNSGFANVLTSVRRVAPTDATVLIHGETGTGKELIARSIHAASGRADKPLIKLDCLGLAPDRLEPELFGLSKSAGAGADRREGRFELAHGGTLLIDEIAALGLPAQEKLLHALQEHEIEPVGSNYTIRLDVRVIATTQRDLRAAVRDGRFREDLYYRLSAFPVELPPLRERLDDIPALARLFAQRYAARAGRRIEAIDPAALELLARHHWPGNVRELEHFIARALLSGNGPLLTISPDLFPSIGTMVPTAAPPTGDTSNMRLSATGTWRGLPPLETTDDIESTGLHNIQRMHILRVLDATRWVIEGNSGAAIKLGMKPATLRHRMKKLGISRAAHRV